MNLLFERRLRNKCKEDHRSYRRNFLQKEIVSVHFFSFKFTERQQIVFAI